MTDIQFTGYADDDELFALTLNEYVRERKRVIGDEFDVTACFEHQERYRIASGGPSIEHPYAPFVFEPMPGERSQRAYETELLELARSASSDEALVMALAHWGSVKFGSGNEFTKRLRRLRRVLHNRAGDPDGK